MWRVLSHPLFPMAAAAIGAATATAAFQFDIEPARIVVVALGLATAAVLMAMRNWRVAEIERPLIAEELNSLHDAADALLDGYDMLHAKASPQLPAGLAEKFAEHEERLRSLNAAAAELHADATIRHEHEATLKEEGCDTDEELNASEACISAEEGKRKCTLAECAPTERTPKESVPPAVCEHIATDDDPHQVVMCDETDSPTVLEPELKQDQLAEHNDANRASKSTQAHHVPPLAEALTPEQAEPQAHADTQCSADEEPAPTSFAKWRRSSHIKATVARARRAAKRSDEEIQEEPQAEIQAEIQEEVDTARKRRKALHKRDDSVHPDPASAAHAKPDAVDPTSEPPVIAPKTVKDEERFRISVDVNTCRAEKDNRATDAKTADNKQKELVELLLQPIFSLQDRVPRYFEAYARAVEDQDIATTAHRENNTIAMHGFRDDIGIDAIDQCIDALDRVHTLSANTALFCNISIETLQDPRFFDMLLTVTNDRRDLGDRLVFELNQREILTVFGGIVEAYDVVLRRFQELGFNFSLDHIANWLIDPARLSEAGFRFVKFHCAGAVERERVSPGSLAHLRKRFERENMDVIVEKIERRLNVDAIADAGVRFGQGRALSEPRLVSVTEENLSRDTRLRQARAFRKVGLSAEPVMDI